MVSTVLLLLLSHSYFRSSILEKYHTLSLKQAATSCPLCLQEDAMSLSVLMGNFPLACACVHVWAHVSARRCVCVCVLCVVCAVHTQHTPHLFFTSTFPLHNHQFTFIKCLRPCLLSGSFSGIPANAAFCYNSTDIWFLCFSKHSHCICFLDQLPLLVVLEPRLRVLHGCWGQGL